MRAYLLVFCLTIALLGSLSGQTASPTPAASPSPSQSPAQSAPPEVQTKDGEKIYAAGVGDVKAPRLTHQEEPEWSKASLKRRSGGSVGLDGYVGTDGKYHVTKVSKPLDPNVNRDAIAGVSRWKFKPCTKDGKPVNCSVYIEVDFFHP